MSHRSVTSQDSLCHWREGGRYSRGLTGVPAAGAHAVRLLSAEADAVAALRTSGAHAGTSCEHVRGGCSTLSDGGAGDAAKPCQDNLTLSSLLPPHTPQSSGWLGLRKRIQ